MAVNSVNMRAAMNPHVNQAWLADLLKTQHEAVTHHGDPADIKNGLYPAYAQLGALVANCGSFIYDSLFTLETMLLAIQYDHPTIFQRLKDESKLALHATGILPALRRYQTDFSSNIVMQNAHLIQKLNQEYFNNRLLQGPAEYSSANLPDSIPAILQTYSRSNLAQADRAFIERNSITLIDIMNHHLHQLNCIGAKEDGYFEFRSPTAFKNPMYGKLSSSASFPDWEYYSGIGVAAAVRRIMNEVHVNWANNIFQLNESPVNAFNWWHEEASYARFKFQGSRTEIILAPRSVHWLNLAPVMKRILVPACAPLPLILIEDCAWVVEAQNVDSDPTPVYLRDPALMQRIATHLSTVAAIFTALAFAIPSGKGNHKPQWMSSAPNVTLIKTILAA